jgi:[protein-PII] uridylyltransferase
MRLAREEAQQNLEKGMNGIDLSRRLSAVTESMVKSLSDVHLQSFLGSSSSGVAVLATGSFGRGELAPYSDLDLLFLCSKSPDAKIESLARAILMPLWDARLDAGHAVRSFADGLDLPAKDLTAATALLDARFLTGDESLARKFLASYEAKVASTGTDSFVARLRAEQEGRHSRFGDTIYMLEPDIKNGPGGIRDLCTGRWAAMARYQTFDPDHLEELGEMSQRQSGALKAALEFMLRLRVALHLEAHRRQDQLRFDLQERLAPRWYDDHGLYDPESRPAVTPSVESLMHAFQTHARTIQKTTERLMQRVCVQNNGRIKDHAIRLPGRSEDDPSYVLRKGRIEVKNNFIFTQKTSEILRIFLVSQILDLPIGLATSDLLAECASSQTESLRRDPEAAKLFLEILTNPNDTASPSRLEVMHDLGLLAAMIEGWAATSGRVQHDIYHVYTVDQHSLYGVATLKAVARGDLLTEYPQVCQAFPEVRRTAALYLGLLLHDVGKPLGSNHAEKGALIARNAASSLGMLRADVDLVEFLVREHLDMGHTSQRRDLSDPSLLDHFVKTCGTEERLRQLFILTFCDLTSTGPKTMTRWKYELLFELFDRTLKYMRRGPDLLAAERTELVEERQAKAAELLGESVSSPNTYAAFAGLPDRYFAENEAEEIAKHVHLARGRRGVSAISVKPTFRGTYSELVLIADDVPGLLAKVTGVFYAHRIDILDAAIYSRDPVPSHPKGEALDIFRVRREPEGALTDAARIASIHRDLTAVLEGRVTVAELVSRRPPISGLFERAKPKVPPTQINVDNDASRDFTIVEVFTEDRPGVLYTITKTLAEFDLDIHRSRVGVAADQVADIFYVRDNRTGDKIDDETQLESLKAALKSALPVDKTTE